MTTIAALFSFRAASPSSAPASLLQVSLPIHLTVPQINGKGPLPRVHSMTAGLPPCGRSAAKGINTSARRVVSSLDEMKFGNSRVPKPEDCPPNRTRVVAGQRACLSLGPCECGR
ncbi:hypothetical protein JCM11251_006432 [Rhodosporidiobolus azoricus]